MKYKLFLFSFLVFTVASFSQHLPLQIGNQWHYNPSAVPGGINYASIAVDTVRINNLLYYEIERRQFDNGTLLETTFDRLVGDSAYYRIRNGEEKLIINFNLPDGHITIIPYDTSCFHISILSIGMRNVWGFNTQSFSYALGEYCVGWPDTAWVLFHPEIVRKFGCYTAYDGFLVGAIINDTTYGTLYPLPVELLSFNGVVDGDEVNLEWITGTEVNNRGFELYRKDSFPNSSYKLLAFIQGIGTTTERHIYNYIDRLSSKGKIYYKLMQYDFDGTSNEVGNIELDNNFLPNSVVLYQNYPNPFNPSTNINFSVPEKQFIQLKIFNLLGKEIKLLVEDYFEAGIYNISFDASELSSGIYFYQINNGSSIQTRQMVLLK